MTSAWHRVGCRSTGQSAVWLGIATACLMGFGDWAAPSRADDLFDVPALIATPLRPQALRSVTHNGIVTEEVRFFSERDGDTDVEIFAFFSYPEGAVALPAYIWNPGGLGQASPAYTEAGAQRGYATLCIDFPQPGYRSTGNYPINSGLILPDDPRQAPIYHGVVALLKAVSYLESRREVDRERIGMAGSSWGGFFTTLLVGIDPRLKVGACLYGTGSLQLGNAWWDGNSTNGRTPPSLADRARWQKTLDPAWRLQGRKTPIAWFTGTNDQFYFLSSISATYDMVAGPGHLTLVPNWDHALPQVIHDASVTAWLDEHLQGRRSLPRVSPLTVRNEDGKLIARWTFDGQASRADLIASYGPPGNWRGRYWHTLPATIDGAECRAELPPGSLPCLVSGSVDTRDGLRSSTQIVTVEAPQRGVKTTTAVPDYDGCREWGGFETSQIQYLDRHHRGGQTRWIPQVSDDAFDGKQSAIVPQGQTVLPPLLSTATVPHRFSAMLKADAPIDVIVQLVDRQKTFRIGTNWTRIALEYTPPVSPLGETPAIVQVPAGATVLLDSVQFHPIPEN